MRALPGCAVRVETLKRLPGTPPSRSATPHQADRNGSGRLEPREVAALLRQVAPHLGPEELRVAVVALFRNMVGGIILGGLGGWGAGG